MQQDTKVSSIIFIRSHRQEIGLTPPDFACLKLSGSSVHVLGQNLFFWGAVFFLYI